MLADCPLLAFDRRLRDARAEVSATDKNYFQPDQFRRSLNSSIQTLRNVTFILQKQKNELPGFATWYEPWQERMRADSKLKWLVESRNIVVKQGDLETHSTALISLYTSWFEPPKVELPVPPFLSQDDVAHFIAESIPRDIVSEETILKVERLWREKRIKDCEVIDVLEHCLLILNELALDAHLHFGQSLPLIRNCDFFEALQSGFDPIIRLKRVRWIRMTDICRISMEERPHNPTPDQIQKAGERYAEWFEHISEGPELTGLKKDAYTWFSLGMTMMKKDGCHPTIAIIQTSNNCEIVQLNIEDRPGKHLAIRNLADKCREVQTEAVFLIGEVWIAKKETGLTHAVESKNKKEALSLTAVTDNGEFCNLIAIFERKGGKIIFPDGWTFQEALPNIMRPVMEAINRKQTA